MLELNQNTEESKISKATRLLGLNLSDSELNELQSGNYIFLEDRSLSEIGLLFIMASAMASYNKNKAKYNFLLNDLTKVTSSDKCYSSIPIYTWKSNCQKMSLLLSMIDGKLMICSCCHL